MYDSANPEGIPRNAEVIAGYMDGIYAWKHADWGMWPDAEKVIISVGDDVQGTLAANVKDVENGAATAETAVEWVIAKERAGHHGATIYVARAGLAEVRAVCRGHSYYVWVADWTNEPHEVEGTVACQYHNEGSSYDLSLVYSQEWLNAISEANRPWPLAS
jgi:hypothetical protein